MNIIMYFFILTRQEIIMKQEVNSFRYANGNIRTEVSHGRFCKEFPKYLALSASLRKKIIKYAKLWEPKQTLVYSQDLQLEN